MDCLSFRISKFIYNQAAVAGTPIPTTAVFHFHGLRRKFIPDVLSAGFLTISATFHSLFDALKSTVSKCSDAICGQTCGQRALLDQARHPLSPPVQKGSSCCSGFGVLYLWGSLNASHFCPSGVSVFSTPNQR